MQVIPWYKKILSYFYPITILKESSEQHETIKVLRYQGQWLLESKSALYSEGSSYKPFKYAFAHIKKDIHNTSNFLLLGGGLCSAVKILQERYEHFPACDIVDYDKEIITLNKKLPSLQSFENIKFHCQTAKDFLEGNNKKYDLIGIDLFQDMDLAPTVLTNSFLDKIKNCASTQAFIIINTIFSKEKDMIAYETQLKHYFKLERINYEPNYIFIGRPIT